jgi:hypothetical protein
MDAKVTLSNWFQVFCFKQQISKEFLNTDCLRSPLNRTVEAQVNSLLYRCAYNVIVLYIDSYMFRFKNDSAAASSGLFVSDSFAITMSC